MNIEDHEEYGADQIQILKGLEAVRKRPHLPEACTISYTRSLTTQSMRRWLAPATISR